MIVDDCQLPRAVHVLAVHVAVPSHTHSSELEHSSMIIDFLHSKFNSYQHTTSAHFHTKHFGFPSFLRETERGLRLL